MPASAEPFWLCHECHAEMHPLMVDGVPHCASCSSDFLEILDEAVNPPSPSAVADTLHYEVEVFEEHDTTERAQQDHDHHHGHHHHHHHHHDHHHQHDQPTHDHTSPGGILSNMLSGLFGAYNATDNHSERSAAHPAAPPGTRTMTFQFPGGGVGSIMIGRPERLAPSERGELGLESFFEGFGANAGPGQRRRSESDGLTGQRVHQEPMDPNELIESMLGMLLDGRPPPGGFPGAAGGPIGNLGDYVLSQEGFDNVMEHLMTAAGPQGPVPASQIVIDGLPRFTMTKESLETSDYKDCPVCKDDFEPGDEVMRVPCTHIFHVDCLKPWLERNGSCPVCRFSLVPEGAQRPANPNPDAHQAPEGAGPGAGPGSGLGNFLSSLFSATLGGGQSSAASVQEVGNSVGTPEPTPSEAPGAYPHEEASVPPPTPPAQVVAPQQAHSGQNDALSVSEQYPSAIPQDYRERHARRQAEEQAEEERLLRDLD